jgi:hypothetical protein
MGLFLVVAGGLTCAFFLYVLVQIHRELKRTEGNQSSNLGGGLQVPEKRSSSGRADSRDKKIQMILRKAVENGRAKHAARKMDNSRGIPYVEAFIPIGFVVTPIRNPSVPGHNGTPSKRIA